MANHDQSCEGDRYKDNPFLRLLDCYVLEAIGQLEQSQGEALRLLEPRLRETFHSRGTWQQIVEEQLDLKPAVLEEIGKFWMGYQAHVSRLGHEASPHIFVKDFVAQNFPGVVDDSSL